MLARGERSVYADLKNQNKITNSVHSNVKPKELFASCLYVKIYQHFYEYISVQQTFLADKIFKQKATREKLITAAV